MQMWTIRQEALNADLGITPDAESSVHTRLRQLELELASRDKIIEELRNNARVAELEREIAKKNSVIEKLEKENQEHVLNANNARDQ